MSSFLAGLGLFVAAFIVLMGSIGVAKTWPFWVRTLEYMLVAVLFAAVALGLMLWLRWSVCYFGFHPGYLCQ